MRNKTVSSKKMQTFSYIKLLFYVNINNSTHMSLEIVYEMNWNKQKNCYKSMYVKLNFKILEEFQTKLVAINYRAF